MTLHPVRCNDWSIPHGYFPGFVEDYRLNIQYDPEERYLQHRAKIASSLGLDSTRVVFANQIHSATVQVITAHTPSVVPNCDGLVTHVPGITLGVYTADCAPVLFWDGHEAIGVCHAGWKGALYGVLEHTVHAIQSISAHPQSIHACIGPTIRVANYRVSSDFYTTFFQHDPESLAFFHEIPELSFDLSGYIAQRLRKAGCARVFDTECNTFGSCFFSKRFQDQHNISPTMCFGSIIGTF